MNLPSMPRVLHTYRPIKAAFLKTNVYTQLALVGTGLGSALFFVYGIPILFQGQSLLMADWFDRAHSEWLAAPLNNLAHQILKEGTFPFWNPYNAVGAPLAIELQSAVHSPLTWPVLWDPAYTTWDFVILFRFWISGLGMYLCLKTMHVRSHLSFLFAMLYMFSGHLSYHGNAWHMSTLAAVPFFWTGIQLTFENRWKHALTVLPIATCFLFLGGGLADVLLLATFCSLLGVGYICIAWRPLGYSRVLQTSLILLLLGILGVGLASIYLVPLGELWSHRIDFWTGRSGRVFPFASHWLGTFFHQLLPTERLPGWSSYMTKPQYLHALVLIGWLGVFYFWKRLSILYKVWSFAFLLFCSAYWGKLYGIPFLKGLSNIPYLDQIRYEKYFGITLLGAYVLAALGSEATLRFLKAPMNTWKLLCTLAVLAPWIYLGWQYEDRASSLLLQAFAYSTLVGGFGLSLWLYAYGQHKASILLASIIALGFVSIDARRDFLAPKLPGYRDNGRYEWIKQQHSTQGLYRLVETVNPPKRLASYQAHDFRDYSDTLLKRYTTFTKKRVYPKVYNRTVLTNSKYPTWNHDLLAFANVRYYLMPQTNPTPLKNHQKTTIPYILQNPDAFPRAYVVYQTEHVPDANEILDKITGNPLSFRTHALIEHPQPKQTLAADNASVAEGSVHLSHYHVNEVHLDVDSSAPGFLLLLDQYYPGWEVEVNGIQQTLYAANYLFRGVFIPKGESSIRFYYNPSIYIKGALISIVSLIVLIASFFMLKPRF